jgi:hypothetical protein
LLLAKLETGRVVDRQSLRQARPEDLLPHGCENRGAHEDVGAAEDQDCLFITTGDRRQATGNSPRSLPQLVPKQSPADSLLAAPPLFLPDNLGSAAPSRSTAPLV